MSPLAHATPLSLEVALTMAARHSEAVHSARAGAASAGEVEGAAALLPDPTLNVSVENLPVSGADRFSTAREPMTQKVVGLSQEWVSTDKRMTRQAFAQASIRRELALALVALAETRLQTALAYLDAYYAGEMLKLTQANEHHAGEELALSRARLASSVAAGQEVLALSAALGVSQDESAEVEQQQRAALVALQRWVGAGGGMVLTAPELLIPSESDFVDHHPLVEVAAHEVDLARQAVQIAQADRDPNWTWSVSYAQRVGYSNMVSFGVSVPLPVARDQRQDRELASKLAMLEKAQAQWQEATRTAQAQYQTLSEDAQRLHSRIERYVQAVATPAQQRTAVVMAAYRSNQASLTTLFEARHAELEIQRKVLTLKRELAKTQAQLAYAPLPVGVQP
jgi:outer membrane protein TolC